ncbi:uncharacterized protein LOC106505107 [Sus scrofa]|uniref:uncharacterized protein LOC106505107 n=1 Tax=Sus scrofa TaxID=9823 RepID=UPI000A2B2E66|nr:uncharacterized protein LOC106505107 [Sus scrofa]
MPQRRKRLRWRRKKESVELSGEKGHRDEHSLPQMLKGEELFGFCQLAAAAQQPRGREGRGQCGCASSRGGGAWAGLWERSAQLCGQQRALREVAASKLASAALAWTTVEAAAAAALAWTTVEAAAAAALAWTTVEAAALAWTTVEAAVAALAWATAEAAAPPCVGHNGGGTLTAVESFLTLHSGPEEQEKEVHTDEVRCVSQTQTCWKPDLHFVFSSELVLASCHRLIDQSIQKFPGQESNLCHGSNPSNSSDNTGSITH